MTEMSFEGRTGEQSTSIYSNHSFIRPLLDDHYSHITAKPERERYLQTHFFSTVQLLIEWAHKGMGESQRLESAELRPTYVLVYFYFKVCYLKNKIPKA